MIICINCGEKNNDESRFCMGCGAKLERRTVCPECGETLPADAKFCFSCGHSLKGDKKAIGKVSDNVFGGDISGSFNTDSWRSDTNKTIENMI